MISFFTIPKAFEGHDSVIQRNAIRSWTRLPECQVLLLGNERGTREVAADLDVEWIPGIELSDLGTPLLNSAFDAANRHARNRLRCYVNTDIILLTDFLDAARIVSTAKSRFLMVGQRCNLDVTEEIVMNGSETWEVELRDRARSNGELYGPHGIDYFLFPKESLETLPPFAVGRPAWDNWMIYRARSRRIPVVDATATTLVIHQNHGYSHVKQGSGIAWEGPEADRNRALLGGNEFLFTLRDATHRLTSRGLVGAWRVADIKRRGEAAVILAPPVVLRSLRAARSGLERLLPRR